MLLLWTVERCPHGLSDKETHRLDVIGFVTGESVVASLGQSHEITLFDPDADPFVLIVANVEISRPVQNVPDFFRIVDMFLEKGLNLDVVSRQEIGADGNDIGVGISACEEEEKAKILENTNAAERENAKLDFANREAKILLYSNPAAAIFISHPRLETYVFVKSKRCTYDRHGWPEVWDRWRPWDPKGWPWGDRKSFPRPSSSRQCPVLSRSQRWRACWV